MDELNKKIGDRLKWAREKKGLKQNRVAEELGIHNSTLAKYESGSREADQETLLKLSGIYDVSVNWLLTGNEQGISSGIVWHTQGSGKSGTIQSLLNRSNDLIQQALAKKRAEDGPPVEQFISIPIYGEIKAGYGMVAEQKAIGYEVVAKKDIEDGEYFYLIVKGDSMIEEGIREGCRVLVRQQDHVENGKIGVVLVDGEEATLKRVYYQDDTVILQASNRDIPPRIIPLSDVIIQGQVKRFEVDV